MNLPFKLVLRCNLFFFWLCCIFLLLLLFSMYYLELEGLLPNFVFYNIFEYTFLSLCHFPWEWTLEVFSNFCPLSYWIVLMVHVNFLFGSILISWGFLLNALHFNLTLMVFFGVLMWCLNCHHKLIRNVGVFVLVIDSAEGFLYEWWSIFYDVYASRQLQDQQAKAEASTEVMLCQI